MQEYLAICPTELSERDTLRVQSMLAKYGSFVYLSHAEEQKINFCEREVRPVAKLEDGSIYKGEWKVGTEEQEGRGMQINHDGSVYEGYFQASKANFYGRMLNKDGDIYLGEWLNDKAHGFGYCTNLEGSVYRGFW